MTGNIKQPFLDCQVTVMVYLMKFISIFSKHHDCYLTIEKGLLNITSHSLSSNKTDCSFVCRIFKVHSLIFQMQNKFGHALKKPLTFYHFLSVQTLLLPHKFHLHCDEFFLILYITFSQKSPDFIRFSSYNSYDFLIRRFSDMSFTSHNNVEVLRPTCHKNCLSHPLYASSLFISQLSQSARFPGNDEPLISG